MYVLNGACWSHQRDHPDIATFLRGHKTEQKNEQQMTTGDLSCSTALNISSVISCEMTGLKDLILNKDQIAACRAGFAMGKDQRLCQTEVTTSGAHSTAHSLLLPRFPHHLRLQCNSYLTPHLVSLQSREGLLTVPQM